MKTWASGGLLLLVCVAAFGVLGRASGGGAVPVSDELARRLYGGAVACASGQQKKDGSGTAAQNYCTGCNGLVNTCGTGVGNQTCTWNPCGNTTGTACLFPTYAGCMAAQ